MLKRMRHHKRIMTHEVVLTRDGNESILAHAKSEGIANQLQKTLAEHFESQLIVRSINE